MPKKKSKKSVNRFDKLFLLTWKKVFLGVIAWFVAVILHNLVYAFIVGVLKIEIVDEPFFFIIAVLVIPLYFLISIVYTLIKLVKRGR
jgi:hypothetical protein